MINLEISQIAMNLLNSKKFKMTRAQIAKWILTLLPKKLIKKFIAKKTKKITIISRILR